MCGKVVLISLFALLAVFVQSGSAVRCWTCSSDLDPSCNDPFKANDPGNTHRYTLTNCDASASSFPYLATSRSVCKKTTQYVNGEKTIIRGCAWKRPEEYGHECPASTPPSYIRTTYCETCDTDACNGAGLRLPSMLALLIPAIVVIRKVFG